MTNFDFVLFLDIDGVLNTRDFLTQQHFKFMSETTKQDRFGNIWRKYHIDKRRIKILNLLMNSINCEKIVLCSAWRKSFDSVEDCNLFFREVGLEKKIIDFTPKSSYDNKRGTEVEVWLEENNNPKYLVLEDEVSDYHEHQLPFIIKTQFMNKDGEYYEENELGLTEKHIDIAVQKYKTLIVGD